MPRPAPPADPPQNPSRPVSEPDFNALWPGPAVAKLCNLSDRRLFGLVKEGVIPKAERGLYPMLAANHAYIEYLRDRIPVGGDGTGGGGKPLADERTRKLRADATMAELELAKAQGRLVDSEVVLSTFGDIFTSTAARLQGIGARVAPLLELETTTAGRKALIDQAVREALHDITDPDFPLFLSGSEPVSGAREAPPPDERAAETAEDGEPVGGPGEGPVA